MTGIHNEDILKSLRGIDKDIISAIIDLDDVIVRKEKYHSFGCSFNKKTGLIIIEFEKVK